MKILIDADGCPVVDISIKIGEKFNLDVIIMCDTSHNFNKPGIETIILSKGADAVDFALVNKVKKGDIVVTQDYGLAAMVLARGGYPINQNGLVYNNQNIDQMLFTRYISKKVRDAGGRTKGNKKRKNEDNLKFEENMVKLCESIM
ncbi:MAG: YaiI/YqxD family protein [Clostridia bacterium]